MIRIIPHTGGFGGVLLRRPEDVPHRGVLQGVPPVLLELQDGGDGEREEAGAGEDGRAEEAAEGERPGLDRHHHDHHHYHYYG